MQRRLTFDDIRGFLPELEDLEPLMERIIRLSEPDAVRRWAGSGELATMGDRLVDPDALARELPQVLDRLRDHMEHVLGATIEAIRLVSEHQPEAAIAPLLEAADRQVSAGRHPAAEAFVAAALRLSERVRDRRSSLPAFLSGARIARARGRLSLASERYAAALALARQGGEPGVAVVAAIGLGNVEVDQGRWKEAHHWYDEAEALLAPLGTEREEWWHLALNRCIVSREAGELERAGGFLEEAEARAGGHSDSVAIIENARGQLALAMGEVEGAEAAFRAALAAADNPDARVTIGVNLAEALLSGGRVVSAGDEARRAEEEALASGVVVRLPEVYRVLGEVAATSGMPDAFLFFERALDVIAFRNLPDVERIRVLEAYARSHEASGQATLAETLRRTIDGIREQANESSEKKGRRASR